MNRKTPKDPRTVTNANRSNAPAAHADPDTGTGVVARVEILLLEGGGSRARVAIPQNPQRGAHEQPSDRLRNLADVPAALNARAVNALMTVALAQVHGAPGAELQAFVATFKAPEGDERGSLTAIATMGATSAEERLAALTKLLFRIEAARGEVADEIANKNLRDNAANNLNRELH